jgi:hypothetical protein
MACNPKTGNCEGSGACSGVQCPTTTACDPIDALCKCGGVVYPPAVADCSVTDGGCSPACRTEGPRIVNSGVTFVLPVANEPWEIQLSAVCGEPPYQWDPDSALSWPSDAALGRSGRLRGFSSQTTACPETLQVMVTDQAGRTDRGTFYLVITAPDAG